MFCIVQFARHCAEFHGFHIKRNDVVVIIVLEVKFVSRLALIEIYLKYWFFLTKQKQGPPSCNSVMFVIKPDRLRTPQQE